MFEMCENCGENCAYRNGANDFQSIAFCEAGAKNKALAEIARLRAQVAALIFAGEISRTRGHANWCDGNGFACNCGKAAFDYSFDAAKGVP